MKKSLIFVFIGVAVVGFGLLVFFGIRGARGVPVTVAEKPKPRLEVSFVDKQVDLSKGIEQAFWNSRTPLQVDLLFQVMVLPWPRKNVPSVTVKAFHNKKDIYFYMQWEDDTEDTLMDINRFSDAGAVMFPLKEDTPPSTLMMGFMGSANIWQWKATQDKEFWTGEREERKAYVDFYYPFEKEELFGVSKDEVISAVNDLLAVRVATVTLKPIQNLAGRGAYENGIWTIVFRRALQTEDPEADAQFDNQLSLCAFAVWNGSKGDRGGRKSISDWVELSIQ